ncbi:MAG: LamG domain-containing protein, partial [Clostridia bacterium]|nr:LamG domain-containing protein [Clostridia bacterium]
AEEIQKNAFSEVMDTNGLLYGTRFTKTCLCAENATGIHTESDWIVDFEPTDTAKGIKHIECAACHTTLTLAEIAPTGQTVDYTGNAGLTPTDKDLFTVDTLAGTPRTFEFSFILPKSYGSHLRGGVLFSNYNNGTQNQISIEIYTNGQARFWYKVNGVSYSALFAADVRSNSLTHLAFTVDGKNISLYVNGIYSETLTMGAAVPTDCTDNFCIGGDRRSANAQYFKGTIYSANVFDDVRTAEEIALDAVMVTGDTDGLLYSKYFSN